jgi:hypothetical protein
MFQRLGYTIEGLIVENTPEKQAYTIYVCHVDTVELP